MSGRIANSRWSPAAVRREAGVGELQDRDRVVVACRPRGGRAAARRRPGRPGRCACRSRSSRRGSRPRSSPRPRTPAARRPETAARLRPEAVERVAGRADHQRAELVGLADRRADGRHLLGSWSPRASKLSERLMTSAPLRAAHAMPGGDVVGAARRRPRRAPAPASARRRRRSRSGSRGAGAGWPTVTCSPIVAGDVGAVAVLVERLSVVVDEVDPGRRTGSRGSRGWRAKPGAAA